VFTKRLGTGVIGTALKRGTAAEDHVTQAIASMLTLNARAAELLALREVHGCTDVSGFGLLGHAREMALGSDVTLEIESAMVPLLPGALEYARGGVLPGGQKNNRDFVSDCVEIAGEIPPALLDLLYDPQTSGGLLATLPASGANAFLRDYPAASIVGRVLERSRKPLLVL
jgi:selenide,water dikinase